MDFQALFYFRVGAWKRTTKGNIKVSKGSAATPPPWFPPLESPFRGAPSARNGQRGKPIPTSAGKAIWCPPSWTLGAWRKPLRGLPFGSQPLQSFFFPLTVGQERAAVAPAAGRCRPGAKAVWRLWVSVPEKTGPESQRPCHLSPAHPVSRFSGMWQSRLRFGTLQRICHPIRPKGLPSETGKQQVKEESAREEKVWYAEPWPWGVECSWIFKEPLWDFFGKVDRILPQGL